MHRGLVAPIALVVALAVVSCSPTTTPSASTGPKTTLSPQDARALKTLGEVAGVTSDVAAHTIKSTECWLPSEHLIVDASVDSSSTWRVLCRIHYSQNGVERYKDTTCVGDFEAEPMLTECYRWTPYSNEPEFEDFPAVPAG